MAIAAACLAVASAGVAGAGSVGGPILGLAVNPAANAPAESGVDLAVRAGAKGAFISFTWSALEPSPRRYNRAALEGITYLGRRRGLKLLVGIQVVNSTAKAVPDDLAGAAFDSPRIRERFHALVDALRPYLAQNVVYVSIGNEVDVYLGRHPAERESYLRFYEDAVEYLHRAAPAVKIGVTTTFGGATRKQRAKTVRLNQTSDVLIHTYYPLEGRFRVRSPRAPLSDLPKLVRLAGGRPVVLQEVGYPDSQALGSSRAKQAAFVASVLAAWRRTSAHVPFLNVLLLHDLAPSECAAIARYYGRGDDRSLTEYLCTLGLRSSSGTPKPAWRALLRGSAGLR